MAKRNLRRLTLVSNDKESYGICEDCGSRFLADSPASGFAIHTQIREKFKAHKCKPEDFSKVAVRLIKDSAKDH